MEMEERTIQSRNSLCTIPRNGYSIKPIGDFTGQMDLERERGITIKAYAVRVNYRADDDNPYRLSIVAGAS